MDEKKEKILVTGGAGYIGSVLVGHLLQRGYQVTVLDNLLYGQASLSHYAVHTNFNFVRGDVRDEAVIKKLLKDNDVIFPLAAIVGAPACDRDPYTAKTVNYEAIALLNRLRSTNQRVIFPNSNSGYGRTTGEVYCTEETLLEPISLYGQTKVNAEKELLTKPNTIVLRLATVFGPSPRMRLDLLVNDFVYRAVNYKYIIYFEKTKDFKRNFIHIDDVAECFCFCLEHFDDMKGEAYNLGLNEANISIAELAAKIKEHIPDVYLGTADIGDDPDKRNYIVSNAKINKKGFTAQRSLDEGIEQLISWCRMLPPTARFRNA